MLPTEAAALTKGAQLVLTHDHAVMNVNHVAGTIVTFDKVLPAGNAERAFVYLPGGKPFPCPLQILALPSDAPAAEASPEVVLEGPVVEYIADHLGDREGDEVSLLAYVESTLITIIQTMGSDESTAACLEAVASDLALSSDPGVRWSNAEGVKFLLGAATYMGFTPDPLLLEADAALSAPKPAPKAAPATAPKAAPAVPAKPPATEAKPAATAAPKVGGAKLADALDANHRDAMRILAGLLPIFAESPATFDAAMASALVLLKRTTRKLDTPD